jgi:thioredoxin 1
MSRVGILSILAGISCLAILLAGCGEGPKNGIPIAGTPDGVVEYLAVTDAGEIEHKEGNFLELVNRKDQKLVLVDFWATWCGPCVRLAPQLEQIRKDWGDKLEVVKVDVDQVPQIAQHLGINSIPDVRIFRNGTQVGSFVGLMPRAEIEALLKSLR